MGSRRTSKKNNPLQVHEVAAMWRVSKMSIYRLVHSGALRSVRVGRSYRIQREDLERYLAENSNVAA